MSSTGRIAAVESLRAIAALSIVGFHAALLSGLADSGSALAPYTSRLEVGVTVFFLISGFLLYRPFVAAHLNAGREVDRRRYALSRVLRIVPGYWVALFVIAIWLSLEVVFTRGGTITYFGFLQVYRAETFDGGLVQAWSLCVEIVFYAFLPFYAAMIGRRPAGAALEVRLRREWIGLAILFALGTAYQALVLSSMDPALRSSQPWLLSFPAYLDQFALGMGLAVLTFQLRLVPRERRWLGIVDRWPAACIAVSLVAFILSADAIGLGGGQERIGSAQWAARHELFSLVALGLMVPAVIGTAGRGTVRGLLSWRPLRWLGDVSYGIFLWHLAVLTQMSTFGFSPPGGAAVGWLLWVLIALVPTVALAASSWRWVEKPALWLRSRFAPPRDDAAADVPSGFGAVAPAEGGDASQASSPAVRFAAAQAKDEED